MLCEEIMERDVEFCSPDDSIQDAARMMRDEGIGFLPICDDQGKVIGTVTDRDITIRAVAQGRAPDAPASEVMTEDVVACQPTDDLKRAEQLMRENKVSRVMCLDDGRLVGVISIHDLVRAERAAGTVEEIKEGEAPHAQ